MFLSPHIWTGNPHPRCKGSEAIFPFVNGLCHPKRSLPSLLEFHLGSSRVFSTCHSAHSARTGKVEIFRQRMCLFVENGMAASNGKDLKRSLKRTTGWNEFHRNVAVSVLLSSFYWFICLELIRVRANEYILWLARPTWSLDRHISKMKNWHLFLLYGELFMLFLIYALPMIIHVGVIMSVWAV